MDGGTRVFFPWDEKCLVALANLLIPPTYSTTISMEIFREFFTEALPRKLAALPLPKTFVGFKDLTADEWLALAPLFIALFVFTKLFLNVAFSQPRANHWKDLNTPKIFNAVSLKNDGKDGKDGKEVLLCRCWRSSTFPFCDGTHTTHCSAGTDNAGPVKVTM